MTRWLFRLDRDGLVGDYRAGMSSRAVGKKYGCSMQTVRRELRRRGESIRAPSSDRTYDLDEHFFDVIDTEEKAYWLGFLTADGYVHEPYFVSTRLKRADRSHLGLLKEAVRSDAPIYDGVATRKGKKYPYSGLDLNSVILVRALVRLGVMQAKSNKVKPCGAVPEHLLRHYWRGVFDGDGCISISGKRIQIRLTGSTNITEAFRSYLALHGVLTSWYHHGKGGLVCTAGRDRPAAALEVLYDRANIFLFRKGRLADRAALLAGKDG